MELRQRAQDKMGVSLTSENFMKNESGRYFWKKKIDAWIAKK
jgi:hypothetical protein